MKISAPRLAALRVLYDSPGCASAHVARKLWPESWKRTSRQGVRGQWLPGRAARMLYAMAADGLVAARHGQWQVFWILKPAGIRALFPTPDETIAEAIRILDGSKR